MQMKNGWTGGQFRIWRAVLGVYLVWHFASLLPWASELFSSAGALSDGGFSPLLRLFPNIFRLSDTPQFVESCLIAGIVCSVLFCLGWFDRLLAVVLWYLWACLYGRNPLIGNPSLPFIGWLLLAYALLPGLRQRSTDPASEADTASWSMPGDLFAAAWIVMAVAYSYSGIAKMGSPSWVDGTALRHVLHNPLARDTQMRTMLLALPSWCLRWATWGALLLEASFAPLSLFRRMRPILWVSMVCMHLGLLALINFSDLTVAMLLLHFFTLDPAWIPAPKPAGETIFYDGSCGLWHGFVRFVLNEDRSAKPFAFAPLQGEEIRRVLTTSEAATLPDSLVVIDKSGTIRTRSSAVVFVLERLGGLWFLVGQILRIVPRAVRDLIYDSVASVRLRMLGTREEACPIVPPALRSRFLH